MSKNKTISRFLALSIVTIGSVLGICNCDGTAVWNGGVLNGRGPANEGGSANEGDPAIVWDCAKNDHMITPKQDLRFPQCAHFAQDNQTGYYCNWVSSENLRLDNYYEDNIFPLQHPHCTTIVKCNTQIFFEKHPLSKGTQPYLIPTKPIESTPTGSNDTCTFSAQF